MIDSLNSESVDLQVGKAAEQFTEDVKAGRSPSIEDYARRYPQIATTIRQVFPALALLDRSSSEELSEGADDDDDKHLGLLGDFRLIREIGRGGMGVVFEAMQISLGRRVALKVLPFAAMLDKHQLARFRNEARAAATLDHPHIVGIYSVGVERGVHYYAMQYIEGQSLAEAISEAQATQETEGGKAEPGVETVRMATARTLLDPSAPGHFRSVAELGVQTAEALEHAHQNGILHRDIKPANLLVDDAGKLWITDFGLARIEADATMTRTGDMIGTLRYMSPEQARGKSVMLDERTDVYSLGATLYELLTFSPPFSSCESDRLLQNVLHDEPIAPCRLAKAIPSDLETIVLKAIRKDAGSRYPSAGDLAADLRRFLQGAEIQAKRATLCERAASWARRRPAAARAAVVTLLAFGIMLLLSTALIAAAYRRESSIRQVAESNEAEASAKAKQAEATLTLLLDAFGAPGQKRERHDITVADVLESTIVGLDAKFENDPLTKASLLQGIARCYLNLGSASKATPLLEQCKSIRTELLGSTHPETLAALFMLGEAYAGEGRPQEALGIDERALAARRRVLGANHENTILSMGSVGLNLIALGRAQEAAALLEEAVSRTNATAGPESGASIGVTCNLANAYVQLGRNEEALDMRRKLYERSTSLHGPEHLCTLIQMGNLGASLVTAGEYDEAVAILSDSVRRNEDLRGPNHPDTFISLSNLANAYQCQGQVDEAIRWRSELQSRCEATLGPGHISTLGYQTNLAQCYAMARNFDKAESLYRSSIEGLSEQLGVMHPDTLRAMHLLGECYLSADRFTDATAILQKALESYRSVNGVDHPTTLDIADDLGVAFALSKQFENALPVFEDLLAQHKSKYGRNHPGTVRAQSNLGEVFNQLDRDADAIRAFGEVVSAAPDNVSALNQLAFLLATSPNDELRDGPRAVIHAETSCKLTDFKDPIALCTLAESYAEVGDFESAVRWCLEAIELAHNDQERAVLEARLTSFRAEKPWRE